MHTTIKIEGGLLSPDFLERIADQPGQSAADFGLEKNRSLVDEISAVWSDVRVYWTAFRRRMERAKASDGESMTTITREQWIIPLLEALGYGLTYQRRAAIVDGKSYALSHRAIPSSGITRPQGEDGESDLEAGPPVHIVAFDQDLGSRPPSGRGTMSPHALLQDYLNRTEDLWGLVTNGKVLRLLRDSSYFSRPSYIEFDLQGMMADERFDEFIFLYRLVHRSRLPQGTADAADALLEQYHQAAMEQGGRIRDGLRQAVAEALLTLGNGFLRHPRNETLRRRLADGDLSERAYFRQLLYLIYRLLFLMVAEERGLIGDAARRRGEEAVNGAASTPRSDYYRFLSISRLRALAEEPLSAPGRFDDLYMGFRTLAHLMRDETLAERIGLQALNGELFSELSDLDHADLNNEDLLKAVSLLSYFTPADDRVRRRVNYSALDVEELGSVYESLLDEHPVVDEVRGRYEFAFVEGTERKTTGSYYTPRELVQELIKSALEPVMFDRMEEAKKRGGEATSSHHPIISSSPVSPEEAALLSLRVVDPACGSGHFLLAAARRIGMELARVRSGEDEPAPEVVRAAIRDAITHCIYGVDKNPLAVDLCKVALWIEGHSADRPLTFLDYRIRCGDSLVGVLDFSVLDDGIPDEAYTAVTGDDKAAASRFKKRNKEEREGQLSLFGEAEADDVDLLSDWRAFVDMPEETPAQVRAKRKAYEHFLASEERKRLEDACHLWTTPFFAEFTGDAHKDERIPTTADLRAYRRNQQIDARKPAYAQRLALRHQFFHWPLAFPGVFSRGGFDVVLGNPPWERIKLQEKEWFAARVPNIANAQNATARHEMITELKIKKPSIFEDFQTAKHEAEGGSNFARSSKRFLLSGRGDINTYALFAELCCQVVNEQGRIGIIVPTGIATNSYLQDFFADLVQSQNLVQLIGFENEAFIFQGIANVVRFCLLTVGGSKVVTPQPTYAFYLRHVEQLNENNRFYSLSASDLAVLNPNTLTCALFKYQIDVEVNLDIYKRVPILENEKNSKNEWGVAFARMYDMSNDSSFFRDEASAGLEPLYEAKFISNYDHRYGSYEYLGVLPGKGGRGLPFTPIDDYKKSTHKIQPRYWVPSKETAKRLDRWQHDWLLVFRSIARSVDERVMISCIIPRTGVSGKLPIIMPLASPSSKHTACLLATLNCLTVDYLTRQKISTDLSYFVVRQLPVLPPSAFSTDIINFLVPRVLELTYTTWDLKPFAIDLEYDVPPFKWHEDRRFILQCEVDALLFQLYGIHPQHAEYILDTFNLIRDKDVKRHGEYRTKRLILEIYDDMARSMRTGRPYQTRLDPPPAHPSLCHPPREG